MGCISSKVIARSMSSREELDHSMQRQGNTISPTEESSVSGNINYQILALVRSASTVARKLGSRSFSTKRTGPDVEPDAILDNDRGEAILILEQGEGKNEEPAGAQILLVSGNLNSTDATKRSTSGHWFPEKAVDPPAVEETFAAADGDKDDVGGARSFHTVEEYDAILEKVSLSMAQAISSDDKDDDETTKVQLQQSSQSDHDSSDYSGMVETQKLGLQGIFLVDGCATEDTTSTSTMEGEEHIANGNRFDIVGTQEQPITEEKTFKRKSMAKDLESIEIPKTIEFTAVGSLREWLQVGGQGAYITPKFGSYSIGKSGDDKSNENSEGAIFNPELVAACEECMQQLEKEAEGILKQMAHDLEEESAIN